MYERAAQEFEIENGGIALEEMVEATWGIYFEPRPKKKGK